LSTSVHRALELLSHLGDGPRTTSDLGRELGVHRATAMRLLRTLEDERFVRRLDDGRYRLGPRMLVLARAAAEGLALPAAAGGHLRALGKKCGHTIHLAGVEEGAVVYLDKVESRHAIRMYSRVGALAPAHATGVGKAILAHAPAEEVEVLLGPEPLHPFTPHTIVDREALDTELAAIAERGWALDDFEHEQLIHCVAAPIHDARGSVRAAVSISAPHMVVERDELLALVPEVVATADAVAAELGWEGEGG